MNGDPVRLGWSSSLSGIIVHGRYVLRPRTAGLSVCPRVAVTIPDRPPDRARVGHDPVIRSNGRTVHPCPGVAVFWGYVPGVSSFVGSWPRSWQHCWQQSSARSRTVVIGPHSLARLPLGATATSTVARGRRVKFECRCQPSRQRAQRPGLDLLSPAPFLALGQNGECREELS
jgi:hypothetical protein